ncbi:MAG: sterol carrier protein domain-containing protein [Tropicimonas sp.]|uniref:sterol carrier protein domain-containing protein n=1 Tax=Tropicimonas sp. TaxID=2067044 RepID=UPI003A8C5FE4
MWGRILDVEAALAARSYAVPGVVVVQVNDDIAGGTFALDVDASGHAACSLTTASPDLVIGASDLATLWFGCPHGTPSLSVMHSRGRVRAQARPIGWLSAFFSTTWRRQELTNF